MSSTVFPTGLDKPWRREIPPDWVTTSAFARSVPTKTNGQNHEITLQDLIYNCKIYEKFANQDMLIYSSFLIP